MIQLYALLPLLPDLMVVLDVFLSVILGIPCLKMKIIMKMLHMNEEIISGVALIPILV